jgi:hypothetical protein
VKATRVAITLRVMRLEYAEVGRLGVENRSVALASSLGE